MHMDCKQGKNVRGCCGQRDVQTLVTEEQQHNRPQDVLHDAGQGVHRSDQIMRQMRYSFGDAHALLSLLTITMCVSSIPAVRSARHPRCPALGEAFSHGC